MNSDQRQQAIELYDRFTHEGMDRRDFFARITMIAGSAAAATGLIASIAASPAAAAIVPEDDPRIWGGNAELDLGSNVPRYRAYVVTPKSKDKRGTVLVIHENRGLNAHIRDVARRVAIAGFRAVAPDFLSPAGGTPADENKAREMIGKLDLAASSTHSIAMLESLSQGAGSNGKVGAVGFCWGGAFVNRLAVAAGDKLDAGVSYYGPAPSPAEARRVSAALIIHLARLDERVNKTAWPWITALREAGKPVTYFLYDGVNHAFNNDTSAERYNKVAADLAWRRTLRFFRRHFS